MTSTEKLKKAQAELNALAGELQDHSDRVIGAEVASMAEQLGNLSDVVPIRLTKDFDIAGDDVELSDLPPPIGIEPSAFERVINERDFLPAYFLEKGAQVQKAVARVVLTHPYNGFSAGTGYGTGFMISPSLFMTNNHVIPDLYAASKMRMQFNYQVGALGMEQQSESYFPDIAGTFHTSVGLDYTVLKLKKSIPIPGAPNPVNAGEKWSWIPLNEFPGYFPNQRFNVIQHPAGRRKEIALQNNTFSSLKQNAVRYTADTEPGSSGSPVLDNTWRLVALHHAGGEHDGEKWLDNEGIRIDRLVQDLSNHFAGDTEILSELGI